MIRPPLLFLIALLAAGCAGQPARNAAVERAQTSSQRAAQAFARGDLAAARSGYATSLRIYEALADSEGRARALLSLARVSAQGGRPKEALAMVEELLADPGPPGASTLAMAHGRAAGLYLAMGDAPAAQRHLDQASRHCPEQCAEAAALNVLRARAALARGEPESALILTDAALAGSPVAAEAANALRVRAQAQAALGQHQAAADAAGAALRIDQEQGLGDRVTLDLDLLAQAHLALGDTDAARRYQIQADRARAAARALRGRLPGDE